MVNLLPDESFHNLQRMLFDSADVREIVNFIMQVEGFSASYRVNVAEAAHRCAIVEV